MGPRLSLIAGPLDDVIEVGDDAGGEEGLAVPVPVDPPGVAGAVGEDLESVADRVIAPDPGIDRLAVGVGGGDDIAGRARILFGHGFHYRGLPRCSPAVQRCGPPLSRPPPVKAMPESAPLRRPLPASMA